MKTEIKAKYLQFLSNKKKDENAGFTLIELLVVIIIIGILSAIALPSFLNQSAKAKQSEAKNTISAVNSAQVAYRTENSNFAQDMTYLALGLPTVTNNYTYNFSGGVDSASIVTAVGDTSLKNYAGGNTKFTGSDSQTAISSVICEALTPGTATTVTPTLDITQNTAETAATCDTSNSKKL